MAELNTDITLYSMNKQAMKEEPALETITYNIKTYDMGKHIWEEAQNKKQTYWMLLCHERRDYTVFIPLTLNGTVEELRPTLNNRGEVLSIDLLEDGNYEIWIRDPEIKECFVYYLFNYTYGVISA